MAEPADKSDVQYLIAQEDSNTDRLQADITNAENRTLDRLFTMGRDTSDLRAQVSGLGYQVRDGFAASAKDSEINFLKCQVEIQKGNAYVIEKITAEGEKTRELINDLKTQDLNRMLIERNAEIVEERGERRHWRHAADQGQWATLQSQIQNFASQLGEARASMVNFGSMAGVGQSSTSNNVR